MFSLSVRLGRLGLVVTVALAVVQGGTASAASNPLSGLKVLLTNDDSVQGISPLGNDGKGLYELRRALCNAGADVVVVGPWGQQSGSSARLTTPGFTPVSVAVAPVTPPAAYQADCGGTSQVFGVCQAAACTATSPSASPSDTVLVALQRFLPDNYWPGGPDVVLSGTNFGQNAGEAVNHSGTVGAAITALEMGVPAIACSAELDLSLGIPAALFAVPYTQTAQFAVALVAELRSGDLLQPGVALNVNYPVVKAGETLGKPVFAVVGVGTNLGFAYTGNVSTAGGTYSLVVGPPVPETARNADTDALNANDIPITPLDGDWSQNRTYAGIKSAIAHLANP